jgi:nuclear GTP-binding protein
MKAAQDQEDEFTADEIRRQSLTGDQREVDMGQTKRILGEVYKVIDSSTVVVEVLDARDPLGTRSRKLEEFMAKETPHKHLIFLINKCDLVPRWVVEKAVRRLTRERPTLAFRASTTVAFGQDQLTGLLRQFQLLHKDLAQLTVGFVGYPNVGKSSVINALRREKVCPVAPVPGETKVWRYVTLTKKIYLIDCPGHVYPEDVTDAEKVLRSVTRCERIEEPEHYIQYICERVRPEYLQRTYGIEPFDGPDDLLEKIAFRMGRMRKGGVPDVHEASIQLIRDFQRGRLPWFVLVHSRDIEQRAPRRHEVRVEQPDLAKLQRSVEFDRIDEQEVPDEPEEVEANRQVEELERSVPEVREEAEEDPE